MTNTIVRVLFHGLEYCASMAVGRRMTRETIKLAVLLLAIAALLLFKPIMWVLLVTGVRS